MIDGLTEDELRVISDLRGMSEKDVDLAELIAGMPWLADGMNGDENQVVSELRRLADVDVAFARTVGGIPWLTDDVSEHEQWATAPLPWLAEIDLAIASAVVELPWLADGVTGGESRVVWDLHLIAENDATVARTVLDMPWLADSFSGIVSGMSGSMRRLSKLGLLDELVELPWYTDGLDNEDMALFATLGRVQRYSSLLYDDLLRTRYAKSKSISLPLAGEVRLWAFDPSPFPEGEDTLRMMEEVVRASEAFMQLPFPETDVIMVIPSIPEHGGGGGGYNSDFIFVARPGSSWVSRSTVYHEIGHYYFNTGPFWLNEGGANLTEAITRDGLGKEAIGQRKRNALRDMELNCYADDIHNIQQLNSPQARRTTGSHICDYFMGEHFLVSMLETLREEAVSAALRDLYVLHHSEHLEVTEEEIYRALLKHTPPGLEAEFRALYRRLHGGTYDEEGG